MRFHQPIRHGAICLPPKQQDMGMLDADKTPSVTMTAKLWLQKIRQLIAQGDLDLARQELDEFKLHYPDEDIDPSIVNLLKP